MTRKRMLEAYSEFVESSCKNRGFYTASRQDHQALGALLELQGELGEVTEIFQKAARRRGGRLSSEDAERLHGELGDVLWGFTALLNALGFTLESVAKANQKKLTLRVETGHEL
jgi:NTP pyrophosphatase (non-canonical NTP hydrolase)